MVSRPIRMDQNENPLGPSGFAVSVLRRFADSVHRYDCGEMRALQEKLQQRLVSPHGDRVSVCLGDGADHLLGLVCQAVLAEGGSILEPELSYGEASRIVLLMAHRTRLGCRAVRTPMCPDLGVDLWALARAVSPETRAIFLTNPNNPTGRFIGLERINEWLASIPKEVIIVLDEAYIEFAAADSRSSIRMAARHENLVVIRTLSKVYGLAGLRLGYAIAIPALLERVIPWKLGQPGSLVCLAAAAALDDDQHRARTVLLASQFREKLQLTLEGHDVTLTPSQTNFVFFRAGQRTEQLIEALCERGIRVARFDHQSTGTWLRVSSGTPEETDYLCEHLRTFLRTGG